MFIKFFYAFYKILQTLLKNVMIYRLYNCVVIKLYKK